jgi:hypothetical protein
VRNANQLSQESQDFEFYPNASIMNMSQQTFTSIEARSVKGPMDSFNDRKVEREKADSF